MIRRLCLALVAAGTAAATPAADTYTLDRNHTFPVFEVRHLGSSTQRGRFNKTEGTVSLDLAARKGSVELSIDAASIDMGLAAWDEQMRSEGWFNVARHPNITFRSDNLSFDGDKVVGAEGQFSLLGVSRPLHVVISGFACGTNPFTKRAMCSGDATATIRRSDFGMTKSLSSIGDEIRLLIPVEAIKD